MARKARLVVPGAVYHVMGRCLEQYRLFSDDSDREYFLSLIEKYLQRTGTSCYACEQGTVAKYIFNPWHGKHVSLFPVRYIM
ncbi:hypothetical protein ACFL5S_02460 [Fibrobacterota bacterium]